MSDEVAELSRLLLALYAEERAEITHRLWDSLPNIKEDLFTYYDQELFEEIVHRIGIVRQFQPARLTAEGMVLCDRVLALPPADRADATHLLWQSLPSMYGLFGEDHPEFTKEVNRRIANFDSGKTVGIPHEVVMARMKEKYG
jgi:hypothetical protein